MVVTLVVMRVTNDAVLNLSILEKEKVCSFLNIASRTRAPSPMLATAASLAASPPQNSENAAIKIIFPPVKST